MPHILMIATGGTIACCETERGLSPALDGTALLGALPELSALCTVETLDLMQLDSTDVTAADRQRMAQAVWQNRARSASPAGAIREVWKGPLTFSGRQRFAPACAANAAAWSTAT